MDSEAAHNNKQQQQESQELPPPPLFEGELDKMRKGNKWRKVYCVFTPSLFVYYKAKGDEFPCGTVPLLPPVEATLADDGVTFTVGTATGSRLITLRAASDAQARELTEKINHHIKGLDTTQAAAAPHSLKRFKTALLRSYTCSACKKPIRGFGTQGFACQACKAQYHQKCFEGLPADCAAFPLKKQRPQQSQGQAQAQGQHRHHTKKAEKAAESGSGAAHSHSHSSASSPGKKKKESGGGGGGEQQQQQQQQQQVSEEVFKHQIIARAKREDEKKHLDIAKVLEEVESKKKPLYDEMYIREVADANKLYDDRNAPLLLELELRKKGGK